MSRWITANIRTTDACVWVSACSFGFVDTCHRSDTARVAQMCIVGKIHCKKTTKNHFISFTTARIMVIQFYCELGHWPLCSLQLSLKIVTCNIFKNMLTFSLSLSPSPVFFLIYWIRNRSAMKYSCYAISWKLVQQPNWNLP